MTPIILLAVALSAAMCALAFAFATHALPFMLGLAAFRLAHACGTGAIVAGVVAIAAATLSFALLVYLREILRSPSAKLVLALAYAAPAAVAGYALVHGLLSGGPMSEFAKQFFCMTCGAFVGISAAARLVRLR